MRMIIEVAFACAMLFAALAVVTHVVVYIGLRRRQVTIQSWRSGMPGYLYRLCEQLPPSTGNARLMWLAKFSDIVFFFAFIGAVITGPLIGQVAK
jgi:hypothetical protein